MLHSGVHRLQSSYLRDEYVVDESSGRVDIWSLDSFTKSPADQIVSLLQFKVSHLKHVNKQKYIIFSRSFQILPQ